MLAGLLLSVTPFPPVALAGIVVAALNLRLLACGRLSEHERRLIPLSLMLSVANLLTSTALLAGLAVALLKFER